MLAEPKDKYIYADDSGVLKKVIYIELIPMLFIDKSFYSLYPTFDTTADAFSQFILLYQQKKLTFHFERTIEHHLLCR